MAALAGMTVACRKKEEPKAEAAALEPVPEWLELTGKWVGTEGGEVTESDGVLRLGFGEMLTAAKWTGEVPVAPFELEYEAKRVDGTDFFGAVTFPAGKEEHVTFVLGGWGGGLIGISSIDDLDASENETGEAVGFESGRWYRVRIVREPAKISVWIDDGKVIDVATEGRKLSLRPGPIVACLPFGFGTWQTTGEIRGARWRRWQGGE